MLLDDSWLRFRVGKEMTDGKLGSAEKVDGETTAA